MTTPVPGLPVPAAASGAILLGRYGRNQKLIAARAALAIYNLWMRLIDPAHFSDGWKTLGPMINGIIASHYAVTAADAAEYYANARVVAGYRHMHVPGQEPDMTYIGKVTDAMGPGQFFHFLSGDQTPDVASTMARDGMRGAGTRMVMMGGRDTVTHAAHIDTVATGWERIIEPGACGFCAMLAGRGAVYKESTVDFRAHDHCHCVARAVFHGQESANDDLSSEWGTATAGYRGKAAIREWNKYWEARNGGNQGTAESPEEGSGTAAIAEERVGRTAISNRP